MLPQKIQVACQTALKKKYSRRALLIFGSISYALLALNALFTKRKWGIPHILITSDLHISSSIGRFQHTNDIFDSLVNLISQKVRRPEIIFVVGDIVDNAIKRNSSIKGGDFKNFQTEVDIYRNLRNQLPDVLFLTTLGTGHDFGGVVPIKKAEGLIGKKDGYYDWRNIRLIWFTCEKGSFGPKHKDPVLPTETYEWLDEVITTTKTKIVLLSHVPLRTRETYQYGKTASSRNYTIPLGDEIYEIINKHQHKISAIFSGHIHKQFKSKLNDIPVFFNPLIYKGSYCELHADGLDGLVVLQKQLGSQYVESQKLL